MGSTNKITLGILAHVDAGKTTLSEAILYKTGEIRKLGRVDHGNAFLDDSEIERNRGITIFSRQARFTVSGSDGDAAEITLIDTPGHVDFAAEMERALSVIDYALLVVSGSEGVQAHTQTLYKMLRDSGIPVLMFINKMDIAVRPREDILAELAGELGAGAVDFTELANIGASLRNGGQTASAGPADLSERQKTKLEKFIDDITLYSPELAEIVLEREPDETAGGADQQDIYDKITSPLTGDDIIDAVRRGEVVPCIFGSALKMQGIDELLQVIGRYTAMPEFGEETGARIYKTTIADDGERVCFLKVTGGELRVRDKVICHSADDTSSEAKINQIRLYSGSKFVTAEAAAAGTVCAVTGLGNALPGDTIGAERPHNEYKIRPFMVYTVSGTENMDPYDVMKDLSKLAEEDPALNVRWRHSQDGGADEIEIRLMGQVQQEVLAGIIRDRFGYEVTFDAGSVLYLETIEGIYEGVGHFEPLRHYAEVHLLVEQGEPGSGIVMSSITPEDELARNWQRLIMTHIEEKEHIGVLTGAPLTDVRITLAAGRAHDKHTSGGDFRESTYRAIRNALMQARAAGKAVLLEPWSSYDIELPSQYVGRAMTDIRQMGGTQGELEQKGDTARIRGTVPASEIAGYQQILTGYTGGAGRMALSPAGYAKCHDAEAVIASSGYDPERDIENTADSVFVSHGASDIVRWDKVSERMHLQSVLRRLARYDAAGAGARSAGGYSGNAGSRPDFSYAGSGIDSKEARERRAAVEKELKMIFERTYGTGKERTYRESRTVYAPDEETRARNEARNQEIRAKHERKGVTGPEEQEPPVMIIDGYNLIFADAYLTELASKDQGAARDQILDRICNFAAYRGIETTVVFDAWKVPEGTGSEEDYYGVKVIYTAENEPADIRIGMITGDIRGRQFYVVSSDILIQQDSFVHGGLRISSQEYMRMLAETEAEIRGKL